METRYTKIKKIGEGGSSKIFLVWDNHMCQKMAMKCIRISGEEPELLERVQQEIPVLRQIHRIGFPQLTDVFWSEDGLCLVMDYIQGPTLAEVIKKSGAWENEKAREIFLQIAELVSYLHDQDPGIMHGDIKPENLIYHQGQIWMLDFGAGGSEGNSRGVLYTRGFSAPELRKGARITKQSDIYSLGCIYYFMLTGKRPNDLSEASLAIRKTDPFIDEKTERIIAMCTREKPGERYRCVGELLQALLREKKRKRISLLLTRIRKIFGRINRTKKEAIWVRRIVLTEGNRE